MKYDSGMMQIHTHVSKHARNHAYTQSHELIHICNCFANVAYAFLHWIYLSTAIPIKYDSGMMETDAHRKIITSGK